MRLGWLTWAHPGGGGTTTVLGPPPGPSATAQSWGAGRVERRMAQASGSSWGSRRVQLGFPPWVSKNRRLWAPDLRGCRWGGGGCSELLPGGSAPGAGRRRSWVPSRAPGGPGHTPSSAAGRGAGARRAPGRSGQREDRFSSRGTGLAQRAAAGAPALCAPAPAAQLLRMTSSHLPLQARTAPRAGGGAGAASGASRGRWEM